MYACECTKGLEYTIVYSAQTLDVAEELKVFSSVGIRVQVLNCSRKKC